MSSKIDDIVSAIGNLSVLEASNLVEQLQDKLGITAMPSQAFQGAASAGNGDAGNAGAAEKTSFDVVISNVGSSKVAVIKAVKDVAALDLSSAKNIVDGADKKVLSGVDKAKAEEAKKKLEEAGATVELK